MAASSTPSWPAGKSPMKKITVKVRKPSTGTDCRMSSAGMMTISALRLLAAKVAKMKVKIERREDGGEHAQGRAQRIFGQVPRIERDRRDVERGERGRHLPPAGDHQYEPGEDQRDRREIILIGEETAPLDGSGRAVSGQSGGL